MPPVPVLKPRQVRRVLLAHDFRCKRERGSHEFYEHQDGRCAVLPVHGGRTVSKGVLRDIIESSGLTVDDFTS